MQRLEKILKTVFKEDNIIELRSDHKFADISGFNSLTFLELISALENEFEIQLDLEQMVSIETIGDLKRILPIEESDPSSLN